MNTSLPTIAALTRVGAAEQAWALFTSAGYLERTDDAAAQAVLGRLLKARVRSAPPDERAALQLQAASAYARANEIAPATYLAINAATLRFLAGERAAAADGARAVLEQLNSGKKLADTPYFLAATRAEAHLLLGQSAEAQAAMAQAAMADPDGWPDRAVTVTQLAEIMASLPTDATWLESFRPPATLHFAGHMALISGGDAERALAEQVDVFLAKNAIGFAIGAAAAGCDIVIAERVLARGGEVSLVLPCAQELFEWQSVKPAGDEWVKRYRALLEHATGIVATGDDASQWHDPLATHLAGKVAIGDALVRARSLATTAFQIVALDRDGGGALSLALAEDWPIKATSQRLTVPRETDVRAVFPAEQLDPLRQLATVAAIRLDVQGANSAELIVHRTPVWDVLAALEPRRIRAMPEGWDVLLESPEEAGRLCLDLIALCRKAEVPLPSIGLAYGIVTLVDDRASHQAVPHGLATNRSLKLARMAPPGTIFVGNDLAAVLAASGAVDLRTEYFHGGEGGPADAVHILLPTLG